MEAKKKRKYNKKQKREPKDVHAGHRLRMWGKFLQCPDAATDLELMEMILYNVMPRMDTNPTAHRLIRSFGDLRNIFGANIFQLSSVTEVGQKAALLIYMIGRMHKIANSVFVETEPINSLYKLRNKAYELFYGAKEECCYMLFLDKNYIRLNEMKFEPLAKFHVSADMNELVCTLASLRPEYAVLMHNHPSGDNKPSPEDIKATRRINLLCSIHGVTLIDHLILTNPGSFSFRESGILEMIKNEELPRKMMEADDLKQNIICEEMQSRERYFFDHYLESELSSERVKMGVKVDEESLSKMSAYEQRKARKRDKLMREDQIANLEIKKQEFKIEETTEEYNLALNEVLTLAAEKAKHKDRYDDTEYIEWKTIPVAKRDKNRVFTRFVEHEMD